MRTTLLSVRVSRSYAWEAGLNPDSAVEREVMSKEQTFRSKDNALLPLRRRRLSARCVTKQKQMVGASQAPTRTLKLNSPVSSLLQVRPSLIF
jgi:hypothetical protein